MAIDKKDIIPEINNISTDKEIIDIIDIFTFAKESIFWLLALIAITVFIVLWTKLIMAKWNAEELKKVLMQFVYSVIWLAIVAISWAAVKLVSSLNF